ERLHPRRVAETPAADTRAGVSQIATGGGTAAARQAYRHRGPRACATVCPSLTGAAVTTVGAWGVCRRHDVLRDWAVLPRSHRGALVHTPIRPAGECTEGDPQAETVRL